MSMRVLVAALATVALTFASAPTAAAGRMSCVVSEPISAAVLNAPNDGTWSFEVFGAAPNVTYNVQVTWPGDPSNGGHPNAGIATDATGYGRTTLQRWWSPDGFLPGYSTGAGFENFVAVPGKFSVAIGPKARDHSTGEVIRAGKTTCSGVVTE